MIARSALIGFVTILCSSSLLAICLHEKPSQVVLLRVESCETGEEYVKRTQPCPQFPWVKHMQDRTLTNTPGVVLQGQIIETRAVVYLDNDRAVIDPPLAGDQVLKTYYFRRTDWAPARSCADVTGKVIEVFAPVKCCDVIPPGDPACWFGVDQVEDLWPQMKKALGR